MKAAMGYYLTESAQMALDALAPDEGMVNMSVTGGRTKGESSLKFGTLLGSRQEGGGEEM